MKFLIPGLLLLNICGLCGAPACADAPPAFLPVRDVTVNYNVAAPNRPATAYQVAFEAQSQRARVDDPAQGGYFLVNLADGTAQMVVPALHSVVNAPDLSTLAQQLRSGGNARFTALGPGHYAGLGCTNYLVLSKQGTATACLTADGVVLHFSGHNQHGSADVTATAVQYGTLAGNLFDQPQGYSAISLPPGALRQFLGQ